MMVTEEIKKKLLAKAKALNLTLTAYIEKIALEPVIYLDENSRTLLEAMKFKPTMQKICRGFL